MYQPRPLRSVRTYIGIGTLQRGENVDLPYGPAPGLQCTLRVQVYDLQGHDLHAIASRGSMAYITERVTPAPQARKKPTKAGLRVSFVGTVVGVKRPLKADARAADGRLQRVPCDSANLLRSGHPWPMPCADPAPTLHSDSVYSGLTWSCHSVRELHPPCYVRVRMPGWRLPALLWAVLRVSLGGEVLSQ